MAPSWCTVFFLLHTLQFIVLFIEISCYLFVGMCLCRLFLVRVVFLSLYPSYCLLSHRSGMPLFPFDSCEHVPASLTQHKCWSAFLTRWCGADSTRTLGWVHASSMPPTHRVALSIRPAWALCWWHRPFTAGLSLSEARFCTRKHFS